MCSGCCASDEATRYLVAYPDGHVICSRPHFSIEEAEQAAMRSLISYPEFGKYRTILTLTLRSTTIATLTLHKEQ